MKNSTGSMDIQNVDQLALQEISRLSINVTKIFGGCMQWGISPLTVLSDKGLAIFDYAYKVADYGKKIAFRQSFITSPKTSPATYLFPDSITKQLISNINHNQMLIDPALWPHNPALMEEIATVTAFQWSPSHIHHNNSPILAVVTNMGNIELFGRNRLGWDSILNLSKMIKELYNHKPPEASIGDSITNLECLKNLALSLETCAICWSPEFNENSECFFVTAQKNSDLLFWLLTNDNEILRADFVFKHAVNVGEIMCLHWIPLSNRHFLLIYSNLMGQLFGLECSLKGRTIITKKVVCLCNYQDRMIVNHLKYISKGGNVILIYAKHRYLIIQMLDKSLTILSQCHRNINQNKIQVITEDRDNLYVCTTNCKIYKLSVKLSKSNQIEMELSLVKTKDSYPTSEMYGFAISRNSRIWALSIMDRKVSFRKEQTLLDIVILVAENQQPEIEILLSNPTKSLMGMWDSLELLRYKSVKTKTLPQIDYNQLYAEAGTNMHKLKLYLLLLTIYKLEEIVGLTCKITFPELSVEKVRETILVKHAQNILDKLPDHKVLEDLDKESSIYANKYIKYYCQKYECKVANYKQCNNPHTEYRCESCDEIMNGFQCKNGHMNMFCTISLTPIVDDEYISCRGCQAIARVELYCKKPTCIFCDIPLDKFC